MKRKILVIISVLAILFTVYFLSYSFVFPNDEMKQENIVSIEDTNSITCSTKQIDKFKKSKDFYSKIVFSCHH